MLFHSPEFFWFLVAVVVVPFLLPRIATLAFLLAASLFFYGWSGPYFILLLLATSLTDYTVARFFEPRPALWRVGIFVSALVNFSILGFFKYANFVLSNLGFGVVPGATGASASILDVLLPVGISFYTFQSFAYTVDVLTGRIAPCRSLVRYLLFVAWFPQLVAGPIMRAGALLPEIAKIGERLQGMAGRVSVSAALFAEGWIRKACADLVAPTSDVFFRNPGAATSADAVFGILAFGLQIYGDFSGYTKMAQGLSWLFGVRLMENFNLPYAASSVRDFWRRWHISLSTWFRDYLYIPLGGNRRGPARNYFNLAFTMLVCGLWHGANWTFIAWGAVHGALLIAERVLGRWAGWIPRPAAHVLTLAFVFLAWVLFRSPDLATAGAAYGALLHGGWSWPPLALLAGVLGLIAIDLYFRFDGRRTYQELSHEAPPARLRHEWQAAGLGAICVLLWTTRYVLGQSEVATFIYFQF